VVLEAVGFTRSTIMGRVFGEAVGDEEGKRGWKVTGGLSCLAGRNGWVREMVGRRTINPAIGWRSLRVAGRCNGWGRWVEVNDAGKTKNVG
jgi:hypothetical protein